MPADSLVNHRLNGYFIESLLGRGGMARVYRAVDLRLQRYVAIKVIDAPFRENPDAAGRFAREAQVIAQLGQHPHIVQLYHYGEDQGYLFIAMQYVDGSDLGALLRSYRQDRQFMPFEDALAIARDLAEALDYIHTHEVVHRDLKPSNVMVDRSGRAILTDFGLALLTDVGTLGEVFGSPAYIAPEQAVSSAEARPESDIYAFGVILFEMLTGQLPFSGRDPLTLAMKHVQQPPPAPSGIRRELGPDVDRVILQALAKDPARRYHTARALVDDLAQALRLAIQPVAPPPTLTHLTIPDRVRQQSKPLPPPTVPPSPAPAPPTRWAAGGQSWREPAPAGSEAYPANPGAPLVIPAPVRARSPWPRVAAVVGLVSLVVVLLCVGSGLAARALLGPLMTATSAGQAGLPGASASPVVASPLPSDTPPPTQPPPPPSETPPEAPTATPQAAVLTLKRLAQDHLLLANTGELRLSLSPLVIGRGQDAIVGGELGHRALDPGECLIILYPSSKPKLPNNPGCEVIDVLGRDPESGFWLYGDFSVQYNDQPVGTCNRDAPCVVYIPVGADEGR